MTTSFFSHLNPIPHFPAFTGPHPVGSLDLEVPEASLPDSIPKPPNAASTVALRLFYPCNPQSTNEPASRPVRWLPEPQRDMLAGIWRFLGLGNTTASLLSHALPQLRYVSIPALRNAPCASPPKTNLPGRWPLMIFSHGLGGNRNQYSYLCGCLASHGIVVAAPDHRDGSQALAFVRGTEEQEAKTVEYRTLKHHHCDETFKGRDEQLQIRIWEISKIVRLLELLPNDNAIRDLHTNTTARKVVNSMAGHLDLAPGRVVFAGHSFGGTTVIQLLKSAFYYKRNQIRTEILEQPQANATVVDYITSETSAILLDPWALPLSSPATKPINDLPLPCYVQDSPSKEPPLLAVLSESFFRWEGNRLSIIKALAPSKPHPDKCRPHIFYPEHSAHFSQSDFGIVFPRLTKYLAKAEEPTRIIDLNVRAVLEVMRRARIHVSPFTIPEEEKDNHSAENDFILVEREDGEDSNDKEVSDPQILNREKGAVRGWVPVPIDTLEGKKMFKKNNVSSSEHKSARSSEADDSEVKTAHGRESTSSPSRRPLQTQQVSAQSQTGPMGDGVEEEPMETLIDSGKA